MNPRWNIFLTSLTLLNVILLSGCQTISEGKKSPVHNSSAKNEIKQTSSSGRKTKTGRPDSIVAIWKDATYTVANQQPTRGFGGRIYFYDRDQNPILVDGDLIIYGFRNEKYEQKADPEKKFVFSREELPSHMSLASAGPSYSVWLPWDHINGDQKDVSIVAVLRSIDGKICQSEVIQAVLPGKKPAIKHETDQLIDEIRSKEGLRRNVQKVGFHGTMPAGTTKIKSDRISSSNGDKERIFQSVPRSEYLLPAPQISYAHYKGEDPISQNSKPLKDSSLGQSPVQNGRFVRQGKLPPSSQPPRLGSRSFPEPRQ